MHIAASQCQNYAFDVDGVLEYYLNNEAYFGGDLYGYRRAGAVVYLCPGKHKLDVRLVRDVRAMGGASDASIDVRLTMYPVTTGLTVAGRGVSMADVVDGKLTSPFASVPVRNDAHQDILIHNVTSTHGHCNIRLLGDKPLRLVPGQTRPVAMLISCRHDCPATISFSFSWGAAGAARLSTMPCSHELQMRSKHETQRHTFIHPSGIVSYTMLRPPPINASHTGSARVLMNLHGAGLEAESDQLAHSMERLVNLNAWILFPSGVTSWAADDWHQYGFADAVAAAASIKDWIVAIGWNGADVDLDEWLIVGHSNGGQGVWYALTHHPDKIVAAAPISGYLSIEKYVPYTWWRESNPAKMAIVQASLNSFRHETLTENVKGSAVLVQHGEADDNVSPYHSRRMQMLLEEVGENSEYLELPGRGHWFEGVLQTRALRTFYRKHINDPAARAMPRLWTFVVANPAEFGPKYGLRIGGLIDAGRPGRVDVEMSERGRVAFVTTINVALLTIDRRRFESLAFVVDDEVFPQAQSVGNETHLQVCLNKKRQWQASLAQYGSSWNTTVADKSAGRGVWGGRAKVAAARATVWHRGCDSADTGCLAHCAA